MQGKDHYLTLGIPRTASPSTVRRAYRDLIRRSRDVRVGDSPVERMQRIREAYEVLSDPKRRREHDEDLQRLEAEWMDSDGHRELPPVEPLAPGEVPAHQEFLIVLTSEEAKHGGLLAVRVPVVKICGACGGTGGASYVSCTYCGGRRDIERRCALRLSIPAGIASGGRLAIDLGRGRTVPVRVVVQETA